MLYVNKDIKRSLIQVVAQSKAFCRGAFHQRGCHICVECVDCDRYNPEHESHFGTRPRKKNGKWKNDTG